MPSMPEISDFYARVSSDPLTMAFDEKQKTLPPSARMHGNTKEVIEMLSKTNG